jgi:hypothetical protein
MSDLQLKKINDIAVKPIIQSFPLSTQTSTYVAKENQARQHSYITF